MTVTPMPDDPATLGRKLLSEVFGDVIAERIEQELEDFAALTTQEEMLAAIYARLQMLTMTLELYKPLLDKATKRMNGRKFG